ncbi:MAG: hypothetical protein Q9199_005016 [Rusavskia elegans]
MASIRIVEHPIPGRHIREYPYPTRFGQDECLQLAVKQYVPTVVEESDPEDVTIVTGHANGFPKVSGDNPQGDDVNGGVKAGQVQSHVFENAGHSLPFSNVEELADVVGKYVGESVRKKMEEDAFWRDYEN